MGDGGPSVLSCINSLSFADNLLDAIDLSGSVAAAASSGFWELSALFETLSLFLEGIEQQLSGAKRLCLFRNGWPSHFALSYS